jgi:DYW family of nucleic acid deaminases
MWIHGTIHIQYQNICVDLLLIEFRHRQVIVDYLAQTRENITKKYRYKPDISCVLQPDMSEEEKLHRLWAHSEKMALAWALLSLSKNGDIIMHNNLRVCHDCHTALKLISKLCKKKFIIRDANRFHHFSRGKCSCNDYW